MTEKCQVPFVEAENARTITLISTATVCSLLLWLSRSSPVVLALMGILTVYLLSGNRYQWIYIIKKTFRRDAFGVRVLFATMYRILVWERNGSNVVTRWKETASKYPHKKAFIMDDRSITFREGDELSNRVARYFKSRDFKDGDVVGLFMESQPEYVFLWLGLAKIKVISALVNTNLRGAQLVHSIKIAKCKVVIFGDELAEGIEEVRREIPDISLFQYNSCERPAAAILQDTTPLSNELKEISGEEIGDVEPARPRDTLMYIYTSGTTGLPKAAIITHLRYLLIPLGVRNAASLSSSDVIYNPLPLHHTAGGMMGAGQSLIFGCTGIIKKKFSASNYWRDISKYNCTVALYIGEICRYLLAVPPSQYDRGHNLKVMIGNGLRPQIWKDYIERFGVKQVVELYGATESISNLINMDSKVGAVGFLCRAMTHFYPLTLVKCDEVTGEIIRNKDGLCTICGPEEPGLCLGKIDPKKALLTFSGYADNAASEKKIVRNVKKQGDCYFNSGDILVMDHFGYIYFKDRTGDTFRWRGENVSTAEVEGVISNLVGLKDTVVYGVAIPNVEGKAGMAAITDPERTLDMAGLAKGLVASLPAYARPLFIRILPEPPLTVTFKLRKKELLEQGYKLNIHNDPIFFLDPKSGAYIPLSEQVYDDLVQGKIRL